MKKLTKVLSICVALLLIVGCGAKPTAFTATTDIDGEKTEMRFDGMGDTVNQIVQTTTIDLSDMSDEEKALMQPILDSAVAQMQQELADIEGTSHSVEMVGDALVEILTIDASNKDSIESLSEKGLLPLEGSASKISMNETKKGLQAAGFTITEE